MAWMKALLKALAVGGGMGQGDTGAAAVPGSGRRGAQTISSLMLVVPVLLGVFLGAPVLARELETGTFGSPGPRGAEGFAGRSASSSARGGGNAVTWAFTELFGWYYHAFLVDGQVSRLLPLAFGLLGIAFAAWTLAAFAIAVFYGALFRRTLPAMAATLATWTFLAIGTAVWLRQHYQAPLKTTATTRPPTPGSWATTPPPRTARC